ncbi:MAG: methyltransferase regulatory domain-containing protein [Candidatus Eutrophobiaceae bacterium]
MSEKSKMSSTKINRDKTNTDAKNLDQISSANATPATPKDTATKLPAKNKESINTYDELPYPSKPFSQSHPRMLATVATLFGMQPADIHNCRVLELGSASGNNIIPMAADLPNSQFIGVELSTVQFERAETQAKKLGLNNLEMRHCNILDIDESFGEFDYIIAHGVFSWVQRDVQEKILEIARGRLKKQGVAYICYNTNPGWRMRGMLRDIMLYHAENFDDIGTKISQSRALIHFLAETLGKENSAYATLLKNEVDLMKNWEDSYFRHDSLEEVNDPVYFHEFMDRAQAKGLQYLGEVDISSMAANNFSDNVKATLDRIGNNIVQREQYMDFIRNRMFRQTLLCHSDVSLSREIKTSLIRKLHLSCRCQPTDPKAVINKDGAVDFKMGEISFSTSCRFSKSIITTLNEHSPEYISFDKLLAAVRKRIFDDSLVIIDQQQLQQHSEIVATRIFELFLNNILSATLYPPKVKKDVSETPTTLPIIRLQAQTQPWVTNCLHQPIAIDLFNRHLLPLMDGSRDMAQLQAELLKLIQEKTLIMQRDGEDLENADDINQHLDQHLKTYMQHAASLGLLC